MAKRPARPSAHELEDLRARLEEAEELLRALRSGEIDAVVTSSPDGERVFTLQGAERPYRILVEAMQEGAVTLSTAGLILYSNRRFAEMLKLPLEQVLGAAIQAFVVPDNQDSFAALLSQSESMIGHAEITLRANDGTLIPTTVALSALPLEGTPAVGLVVTDLTAQKWAEAMIQRLNAELEQRVIQRTAQLKAANEQLEGEITERSRVEADLRRNQAIVSEQREQYRVTLSSIGDAVIATDAQGTITFMNPVAEQLTGWPQAEALGKNIQRVFRIMNEYTRQVVENPVTRVLEDGIVVGLANHTILIARDGQEHPIDDSGAPIRDARGKASGVILVFRDITERRRAERESAEHTAHLSVLADASKAFAEVSRDLRQLYDTITERLATLVGESCALRIVSEDGEWMDLISVFHPDPATRARMWDMGADRRPTSLGLFAAAKETGQAIRVPIMTEEQFRNSTPPHLHPYFEQIGARSLIIASLRVANRVVGFLTLSRLEPNRPYTEADEHLVQDLVSRAALAIENAQLYHKALINAEVLRQQVAEQTRELRQALERAQAADRTKTLMLSNVTHEMRTPLSSIVGFSNLMVNRTLSEEKQHEFTKAINQEGRRLTRLIDDFLDLQRIEAGRQTFVFAALDLSELVREVLRQIELEDDGWTSRISLKNEPVPLVTADKESLRRVVRNLLSNALKFAPQGEITVTIQAADHEVRFSISDQGIGIPDDELGHLFQRFYRGEAAEQQRIRGTGLGLALCREIIEVHHGRIWAESPGRSQGATFRFALPATT